MGFKKSFVLNHVFRDDIMVTKRVFDDRLKSLLRSTTRRRHWSDSSGRLRNDRVGTKTQNVHAVLALGVARPGESF